MKKIKLYIDGEALVADHFSGIGHYILELLRKVDDLIDNSEDIEVYLITHFKRIDRMKGYGFRNIRIIKSPFDLRLSNALKIKNRQPPYDIFFGKGIYLFPNYTSWPVLFSKTISIIYDLSFIKFPEYVEPRNQKFLVAQVAKSVQRSSEIITISNNSQREILKQYKVNRDMVPVLYPGIDQSVFFRRPQKQVDAVKARYGIHGKYILFTGNIEPRKNLNNLLLAYEKLPERTRKEYSLLIVGARGWLDDEIFKTIDRLRIAGNHIQQPIEYVKDDDRPAIYSGASVFVYPSLYEGFGIPPLEAMACGVPVISSDNSSLPEAVGDAAIKINAEDVELLSSTLEGVLNSESLRNKMIVRGFSQVDKFSWTNSAQLLIDVVKKVYKK